MTPTRPRDRGAPDKRLVLAICCTALLISSMDNTVVNVALPVIQRSLGATGSGLQWVVDAYILVLASLLLLSGSLGDRFGRRRMFQTGLVIFGTGSLACSLAPSLGSLVVFRACQGIGGSMLTPSTLSIVANTFTRPAERARAIGLWSATAGLSIGLGPVLGGALVEHVGWPSVFWVNLPICAVALVATARYVPESRATTPRRLDVVGQACAIAALALLTYALIQAPTAGWLTPSTLGFLCGGGVLVAAFLLRERRTAQPLLELGFFRSPPFTASIVVAFVAFLAYYAFIFFNTLYLQEVLGDSPLTAGLTTIAATGLIVVVAPVSGRVVAARGPQVPTTAACLLMAAALVLLSLVGPASPFWQLIASYVVLSVGVGFLNPPITNGAVSGMPRERAGVASATASTARQMGGVFGVALIGSIVFSELVASTRGIGAAAGSVDLRALSGARRHAADLAFTSAIHHGYRVAAAFVIVGAVVALFAMRAGRDPRRGAQPSASQVAPRS